MDDSFITATGNQEARSYLVYLARHQYAQGASLAGGGGERVNSHLTAIGSHLAIEAAHDNKAWPLTEELRFAFSFFLCLLRSEAFKTGIEPEKYMNRPKALVYTDGSRSDEERGIGGVVSGCHLQTCFFAEDLEDEHF